MIFLKKKKNIGMDQVNPSKNSKDFKEKRHIMTWCLCN